MPDQNVTVGMDVSEVLAAAELYVKALNKQNKAITDLSVNLLEFNKKGQLVGASVKALIDGQDALFVRLDKTKKGFQGVAAEAIKSTSAVKKLTAEQLRAISGVATQQIRQSFPVPSSANITQLKDYETSINSIKRALESGKLSQEEFNTIFARARQGNFSVQGVVGNDQARLLSDLKQISKAFTDVERSAKSYILSTKDIFRIAEATLFKTVLGSIASQFSGSISAARDYQIIISQIRTISQDSQLTFERWSEEIRKVSDLFGISKADVAQAAYDAVSNQVVKGAEAFKFLATSAELARVSQSTLTDTQNILSSVINSYNLSVEDSDRISAQLFKTVDLGRIKLSEIANTIGRVTFLGNALGVSFEEIEASLATLTIQGVRTSEAETFLTNVFQKLLKPTEKAQELLNSFGVSSGEAAVKTFGFTGVLNKLFDAFKRGDAEAGDFFNEIRGRKGFEGLTNFTNLFESNLKKITNATKDFAAAKEIRAESPADFLTKELTKIKNVFVDDVGQAILQQTADLVKFLQPITPSFKTLGIAVKFTAGALATYQAVVLTSTAATKLATVATGVQTGFLQRYAVSATAAAVATTRLNTALQFAGVGLLAAGVAFVATEFDVFNNKLEEGNDTVKRLAEETKRLSRVGTADVQDAATARFNRTKENVDKSFQLVLQTVARVDAATSGALSRTREQIEATTDSLNLQFKTYEDGLQRGLARLQTIITDARREIERSQQAQVDFVERNKELIFNTQFKFATPDQQIELTKNKIRELVAEAEELSRPLARGASETEEQFVKNQQLQEARFKAARDKLNEAQRLTQQNFDAAVNREIELARLSGNNQEIQVSTVKLQQELNTLKTVQEQIEGRITKNAEEQLKRAQRLKAAEQSRVDAVKASFEEFSKFTITDKAGNVKKDFETKGKVDVDKVTAELDKITKSLSAAVGNDVNAQIQLFQLIQQRKTQILVEAEQLRTKVVIEEERKRTLNAQKETNDQLAAQRKLIEDTTKVVPEKRDTINNLFAQVEKFTKTIQPTILGFDATTARTGPLFKKELETIKKKLDDTRRNAENVNGQLVPNQADSVELLRLVEDLRIKIFNRVAEREGIPAENVLVAQGVTLKTIFDSIKGEVTSLIDTKSVVRDASEEITRLEAATVALAQNPALKALNAQFPEVANSGIKATTALKEGFSGTLDSVNRVKDAVDSLKKSLEQLNFGAAQAQGGRVGFATGGQVPGGPRGSDVIPAWLSAGEYVINARSAARFAPLLEAINRSPKYLAQGGPVSNTNVGDINIHLSNVDNPQDFVVQAGKKLRRAIKQGRVQL